MPEWKTPTADAPLLLERIAAWAVLGGTALGAGAVLLDHVVPKWVGNAGAVWFVAAFLAGLAALSTVEGVKLGTLCLVAATVVYYALRLAIYPFFSVEDLVPVPAGWLVVGIITGVTAGWAGARARDRVAWWGAPAGVFLGEAIAVLGLRARASQFVVETLCGVACLWLARSSLRRGLVVALTTLPPVALFATYYRLVLWSGGPP
ncbi:MAG TPA: DUF6518 family protein [Actinomycetota bacterium]|jgi:hypothetical protein